jgi:hypothetical protein
MEQGPLKSALENTEGLIKETVTRRFSKDDYHDSSSYEPLINLEEK